MARTLIAHLAHRGCEVVVVELAYGVYRAETAALMRLAAFRGLCHGVLFAAGDALGAVSGAREVEAAGLRPLGLSGVIGRSPLAPEEVRRVLGAACLTRQALFEPKTALGLLRAAHGEADEAAGGGGASRAA